MTMAAEMERDALIDCHELVSMHEQIGGGSALLLEQERALLTEIDRLLNRQAELEQQVWAKKGDNELLVRRVTELSDRITAGREVHKPFEYRNYGSTVLFCTECSDLGGDGSRGGVMWPCDTDRALHPIPPKE